MGINTLVLVERALCVIQNDEKFTIMSPCQFVRHVWQIGYLINNSLIQRRLGHVPLPEILCQMLREFLQHLLAIFRTMIAILFVFHYQSHHIPVREEQCIIELRHHLVACRLYQFGYLRIKVTIFCYILFHFTWIFHKSSFLSSQIYTNSTKNTSRHKIRKVCAKTHPFQHLVMQRYFNILNGKQMSG